MNALARYHKEGSLYITEGGTETEIMYKFGHKLPHFAMYPLLDDPNAVQDLKRMFQKSKCNHTYFDRCISKVTNKNQ